MTTHTLTAPRLIHAPLWPVYDRAGDLAGAFPTAEAAQAFAASLGMILASE